jgi:hypothetical protein
MNTGQGYYLNPDLKTATYGLPYIGIEASLLQGLVIDKRRAEFLKSQKYKNYYEADLECSYQRLSIYLFIDLL